MSAGPTEPLLSPELLARLESLELTTRKVLRGRLQGERRSRRKGHSVEFADFREYAPGDDLRFLDWNLYARLDRLFLKLHLDEEDLHFHALVDCSRSMDFGQPTKLDFAKRLAAALGVIGLLRADRVRVERLGAALTEATPILRGRGGMRRLLDHIGAMQPSDEGTSLLEGTRRFAIRNRGTGIVVLITDLLDKHGFQSGLRALAARRVDLHVIHVLSRDEIEPAVRGDLRLVDCEDGATTEITSTDGLLARYRRTVAAFLDEARTFCAKSGINYVSALAEQPLEPLILKLLRRRGLVR